MLANVLRWSSSPHDQDQNALPEQIWNTFRCAGCKFGAFPSDAGNQRTFCVYRSINSENRSATQRRFGDHLDQDARNAGWSDPSSTENSTGIISFVMTLPFRSFSTTTSCCAPSRPTGITILPAGLSWLIRRRDQVRRCRHHHFVERGVLG